jgi:transcriptional regulator with XRE-family HTH domain
MASTAGQKVAGLRKAKGWSKSEFAKRVGVKPSTVTRWESTRFNPDREDLEHIADVLDIRAGYLSDKDLPEFANMKPPEIASREALRLFREELTPAERRRTARYEKAAQLDVAPVTREEWRRFHAVTEAIRA